MKKNVFCIDKLSLFGGNFIAVDLGWYTLLVETWIGFSFVFLFFLEG